MEKTYSTKGERLRHARKLLRKSQQFFADILGVVQVGISLRESNKTDISYNEALLLQQHEDVQLRVEWLLHGTGAPFVKQQKLEEGEVEYKRDSKKKEVDITSAAITQRFVAQVEVYADANKLLLQEVAAKLGTSASQWTQIRQGKQYVQLSMLAIGVLTMGVDANLVVSSKRLNDDRVERLEAALLVANEDLNNMRELLRTRGGDQQQKKRA